MHLQKVYLYICIKTQKEQKNYIRNCTKAVDEYLDNIEKSKNKLNQQL
jgi:hypothetical protein